MQQENIMKKITMALLASTIYLSSCNSSGRIAAKDYDDVYYSDRDAGSDKINSEDNSPKESASAHEYSSKQRTDSRNTTNQIENSSDNPTERFQDPENSNFNSNTQTTKDQDGNTYVTNNYYNNDDYYDFAYSSRLRRFYHPYGWNYYDSYYTNMYWYDYDPFSYGVSVYLTYNWWRPQNVWTPGWGISMNCGNPYYGNCYSPYNYGWGGNNYWNGYNQGYVNGYYAGLYNGTFNPYYFNSNDSYSYYYGPRGGRGSLANNAPQGGHNLSELYGRQEMAENPRNPKLTAISDGANAIGRPKREIGNVKAENENSLTPIKGTAGAVRDQGINPKSISNDNVKENTGRPNKNAINGTVKSNEEINGGVKNPKDKGVIPINSSDENEGIKNPKNHQSINPKDYTGRPNHNSNESDPKVNQQNNNSNINPKTVNPNENVAPANTPKEQYSNPKTNPVETNPRNNNYNPRGNQNPNLDNSKPQENKPDNSSRPKNYNQPQKENIQKENGRPNRSENYQHQNQTPQNNNQQRNYESPTRPSNSGGQRPSNSSTDGRKRNR